VNLENHGEIKSIFIIKNISENPTSFRILTTFEPFYEISLSNHKIEVLRDYIFIVTKILNNINKEDRKEIIKELLLKIKEYAGEEEKFRLKKNEIINLVEEISKNKEDEEKNEGYVSFFVESSINLVGGFFEGFYNFNIKKFRNL
jgi:hypothetical protein